LFAWKGSFAVATDDNDGCFVSNEFPCFKVNSDRIDARYLWHYFSRQSAWNEALGLSYGATPTSRNRLKEQHFLSLEVPLPSLSEQRRIVAKIERMAAMVEEASNLKAASTSCLISLTSSFYGHAFQVQKGWGIKTVSEFCENPQYGYTASASHENIGPQLLRITDIQDGKVDWQSVPFCVCPEPAPYLLKENDILFARTGATTGKSFLIKECPAAVFASYLIRLRIRDSVLPEYLYAFFQTPAYWKQVMDEMKGTGQPNCNGKRLANVKVPIPSLPEQKKIVEYLNGLQAKIENLKVLQDKTALELGAMLPSILDKAFEGEL
jgi:type I restriction enzyme, S subunit